MESELPDHDDVEPRVSTNEATSKTPQRLGTRRRDIDDVMRDLNGDSTLPPASYKDLPEPKSRHARARSVIGTVKPIINISGDLEQMSTAAWNAIKNANDPPVLFRHASGIVRIDDDSDGTPVVQTLDVHRLRHRLARVAAWEQDSGKKGSYRVHPPLDVVRDLLADAKPPLPSLRSLVFAPYMTADGQLHLTPGYHAGSHIFYTPRRDLALRPVTMNPTRTEIDEAVQTLLEPLTDFKFVDDASRAHAVSLALAPYITELVGAIPAHAINKPTAGSGGGLLCDALLMPSQGSPAKLTEAGHESEWRRVIFGKLLGGAPVIVIDNVREKLDSAALASAITEAYVEDRLIGTSQVIRVAARRIWVLVGNNIEVSDEINRRTLWIHIDPGVEEPEYRSTFKYPHLKAWVTKQRADLVHAALTVCCAWEAAGRPRGTRTLGSFEEFCGVMGGILDVAGISGFLDDRATRQAADTQRAAVKALVELWYNRFGSSEVGVGDLYTMLQGVPDVMAALGLAERGQVGQRTQLGMLLAQRRDRVICGLKLSRVRQSHGANRWRLLPISTAKSPER